MTAHRAWQSQVEVEALHITNEERQQRQGMLPRCPLRWNSQTADVARAHARDLALRGFKGHVTPEGHGLRDRLETAGVAFWFAAENIAGCAPDGRSSGFNTAADAIAALMSSPGHRRSMLSRRYTELGCGVWPNEDGTFVLVQVFLRPRAVVDGPRRWT
jgi:uncharacterized protein YkwD